VVVGVVNKVKEEGVGVGVGVVNKVKEVGVGVAGGVVNKLKRCVRRERMGEF